MARSKTPQNSGPVPGAVAADATPPAEKLARYVLSPRLEALFGEERSRLRVIIELNFDPLGRMDAAKQEVRDLLIRAGVPESCIKPLDLSYHYIFARLTQAETRKVLRENEARSDGQPEKRFIRRVWPDEPLTPYINRSIRTVKADACRIAFGAEGENIVWAVVDSGIQKDHPHFATHGNLTLPSGLEHRSFLDDDVDSAPLVDRFGHGTHVAGILAGETIAGKDLPVWRVIRHRDEKDTVLPRVEAFEGALRGMAVKSKIMSLKVIDNKGQGYASALIAALEAVARINGDGRCLRIHGVNLSLGYPFDAEWYAAGHSPLCTVVNRLSKDGVVVVAAAGNDGSAFLQTEKRTNTRRVGVDQSINDPGNADEAITVGATHAEAPHTYGVSYFSSRGPTADGRFKPDLVAPGERILSCAATQSKSFQEDLAEAGHAFDPKAAYFREESGTSMAAPHVSGAAAALMSVKPETKGNPAMIRNMLVKSCTDLGRKADFQGAGLLDLMRAMQSS